MSRVGGWELMASRVAMRIIVPRYADKPNTIKASADGTKSLSSKVMNTANREMRETVIKKQPLIIPKKIRKDIEKFKG